MPASPTVPTTSRFVRVLVLVLVTAGLLAPLPRTGRADPLPAGGERTDDLAVLVAHLGLFDDEPAPAPAGPALRRAVTPYAVRLAADPRAVHPLDGRLAVHDIHLGAPGLALRRVALAKPAPEPDQAKPAAPAPVAQAAPAAKPSVTVLATPVATAMATPVATAAAKPQTGPAGPVATASRPAPDSTPGHGPSVKKMPPSTGPAPRARTAQATASQAPLAAQATQVPPAAQAANGTASRPRYGATLAAGPGRSVLVAGDSLSIYLAEALRPMLAGRPGTSYAAKGKISSGLARPDFFDWERTMRELSQAYRPDTVLVMIATNDNQTLTRPDGAKVAFGRPGWEAEYARRVRRLVELARLGNPGARIYWIGAPVMANPRLNADVAAINAVIRRQVEALPGCRFVDVWPTLADAAGHYTPFKVAPGGRRTTRTPDGVHLTSYGARLLADACLASLGPAVASLERP